MNTLEDFLAAIAEEPQNEFLRLTLADWFDDRQDMEKAEKIKSIKPGRQPFMGCIWSNYTCIVPDSLFRLSSYQFSADLSELPDSLFDLMPTEIIPWSAISGAAAYDNPWQVFSDAFAKWVK